MSVVRPGRRPRHCSAGAAWSSRSRRAAFALKVGRDQRRGRDAVRLPHHQGDRAPGPEHGHVRDGQGSDHGQSEGGQDAGGVPQVHRIAPGEGQDHVSRRRPGGDSRPRRGPGCLRPRHRQRAEPATPAEPRSRPLPRPTPTRGRRTPRNWRMQMQQGIPLGGIPCFVLTF